MKSGTATSEVLNTLLGKIKSTNNSGVTVTLNGTSNTGLSFSEAALTPLAENITNCNVGDKYQKTLNLNYTATDATGSSYTVSTKILVEVEYDLPTMIVPAFSGTLGSQTYRKPIVYNGMTIQVMYSGGYN